MGQEEGSFGCRSLLAGAENYIIPAAHNWLEDQLLKSVLYCICGAVHDIENDPL